MLVVVKDKLLDDQMDLEHIELEVVPLVAYLGQIMDYIEELVALAYCHLVVESLVVIDLDQIRLVDHHQKHQDYTMEQPVELLAPLDQSYL